MIPFQENPEGVLFQIKVLPRSSRSEAAGRHGDALKLKITAPPVDGKANEEVVRYLAKFLGVKAARVAIVAGDHARIKTVAVAGMTGQEFQDRLTLGDA